MKKYGDWAFPDRIWELGSGGWFSRDETDEDKARRKRLVGELDHAHGESDASDSSWRYTGFA